MTSVPQVVLVGTLTFVCDGEPVAATRFAADAERVPRTGERIVLAGPPVSFGVPGADQVFRVTDVVHDLRDPKRASVVVELTRLA